MVRALRIQYPGALYHVTNRGNERSAVFKDDVDRNEFLNILSHSIITYGSVDYHSAQSCSFFSFRPFPSALDTPILEFLKFLGPT